MDSPQEVAKRWANRLAAETGKWAKGIQNTTENPMAKAAAAEAEYVAGVQRAVNTGRFRSSLAKVSQEEWKRRTVAKQDRLASGASEAVPRMTNFLTEFLPALESIRQQVLSMPGSTREQRMARATEMMRRLAEWGDQRNQR